MSDYFSKLEPHEWRFEHPEGEVYPTLRCYTLDGRQLGVHIELDLKHDIEVYDNLPMQDTERDKLGRWWDGEMKRAF